MKSVILSFCFMALTTLLLAQDLSPVVLPSPNTDGGMPVMKALSRRASSHSFDTASLRLQDLSNLLWAANGINRPEEGKRTAPSALNAQDIDIYLFIRSGTYLYHAKDHTLIPVLAGDNRDVFPMRGIDPFPSTVCLLVSDISRFRFGEEPQRRQWADIDAGIVTQNILIFCASENMRSRPRAGMDIQKLKTLLKLTDDQVPLMNILVSY